jgi:hypothetical protein
MTGCGGYFRNAAFVLDNSHSKKRDPLGVLTSRIQRQVSHKLGVIVVTTFLLQAPDNLAREFDSITDPDR